MQTILQQVTMREIEQLAERTAMRSGNSATWSKDQTYALYNLTQDQLSRYADAGR